MDSVDGTYNAVHTGRKDGRVHGTRPCTGCVHGRDRVTDGRTMYVARARPCTQSVHGRERLCTRAVNKAVYRVPDRVGQLAYTLMQTTSCISCFLNGLSNLRPRRHSGDLRHKQERSFSNNFVITLLSGINLAYESKPVMDHASPWQLRASAA